MKTEHVIDNIGGLVVEVTKGHIRRGRREQADSCPVALVIRDRILEVGAEDDFKVYVEEDVIKIREIFGLFNRFIYSGKSSMNVVRFVKRFDDKKDVEPFKFRMKENLL